MDRNDDAKRGSGYKGRLPMLLALTVAAVAGLAAIAADYVAADQNKSPQAGTNLPSLTERVSLKPSTNAAAGLNEEEQLARAYAAVFGKRQTTDVESGDFSYSGGKLQRNGTDGLILIAPASHKDSYPVNMGALGIFYLVERNGALAAKGQWPDFVGGSIMGNPPEWEIRTDLTDFPVIVSTAGGVWQGYMCQSTSLTELRPEGPVQIADFSSVYSDSGAKADGEPAIDLEGKIGTIVRNREFEVNFEGSRSFVQRYVRGADGTYTRQPGSEDVPTC